MSTKKIVLGVVNVPEKKFIHFQMSDSRFCYRGLVDFSCSSGQPRVRSVGTRRMNREISLVHLHISKTLLQYNFVKRVSFFGGGMDILINDQEQRNQVISSLVSAVRNLFPEEDVRMKYLTRT